MENQEKTLQIREKIKEIVGALVEKMGLSCEIEFIENKESDDNGLVCNIKTKDSNFLIGQYGINLQALQHIARVLVKQKTEEKINFVLDVNLYRQEKNSSILKTAVEMANQVLREKRAVVLRPMSPYERRIIHMELGKNAQIKTESIGEGENRKVVIKPAELA
jgi:spoIIIJ-associated protein